ncbi:hypothetical protein CapIbe_021564 [Capra ibex]
MQRVLKECKSADRARELRPPGSGQQKHWEGVCGPQSQAGCRLWSILTAAEGRQAATWSRWKRPLCCPFLARKSG